MVVLLSPLLLLLVPVHALDWQRLQTASQAYGATSAIVSALALCGVAASLLVQAQQSRANRLEMVRRYQLDLTQMALEDPETYMPCIGKLVESPATEARQHLYCASWLRFGQMGYEVGAITCRQHVNNDPRVASEI
ncbi:DUF6082 family protein [Nocardia sp. CA2R105]|uniref:DUF6082 family protein n=1 Tax=Nocardia coffeae TaxID=2873381 RepID=UPI001CA757A7|nr:DUF6082 family protein [Nocardia coffeae]MBY8864045.1 DUF6082 family protein [Nocardia coffeae]